MLFDREGNPTPLFGVAMLGLLVLGGIVLLFITGLLTFPTDAVTDFFESSFPTNEPLGPVLHISISSSGQIYLSVDPGVEPPALLDVLPAKEVDDPLEYFGVEKALTIRIEGEDHFYDLHGQDWVLSLEDIAYTVASANTGGDSPFFEFEKP